MRTLTQRQSLIVFALGLAAAVAAAVIVFGGGLTPAFKRTFDLDAYAQPTPVFRVTDFSALPDWRLDSVDAAFPAFLLSCEKLIAKPDDAPASTQENLGADYGSFSIAGPAADWKPACRAGQELDRSNYSDGDAWRGVVRLFFETHFRPVEVAGKYVPRDDGPARGRAPMTENLGVFTGYFEPVYEARRAPIGRFTAPLYSRPDDLVDVNLGSFRQDLAGARVAGRLEGSRLVPYADRKEINGGALQGDADVLAYLDPNDLFFLQIQGSGRLVFSNGEVERVGYHGANGRPYTAIGKVLVDRGAMSLAEASMQSIRAWLDNASPEEAQALREANPSYVFFRRLDGPGDAEGLSDDEGPLGAQGVALTSERSLAVDLRYHPLGAPVYVDIEPVEAVGPRPIRMLMVAQDTGGAIRGPVRGDVYWGSGPDAGDRAGAMNAKGRLYLLLPRARADALAARQAP